MDKIRRILSGAAVGFMCALCCLIPLILIFIGINSLGLYLFLSSYHSLLWVLFIISIAFYWWSQYRLGDPTAQSSAKRNTAIKWISLLSAISAGVLIYLSYTSAPFVLPGSQ